MAKPKAPTKTMLAAIGRVAAECAAVEALYRDLFALLINSTYGYVITSGEDLSTLTLMCRRVARFNSEITDDQVEQLAELVRATELLRRDRNFLVHARWERLSKPGEHGGMKSSRVAVSTSGQQTEQLVLWTPDLANELADQFHRLGEYLEFYMEKTVREAHAVVANRADSVGEVR
jgi:hypothetical protein